MQESLHVRLNKPTLIDELMAYLRSLGHGVAEDGYATLRVQPATDERARLEFHLTIWESVRSLEQPGVETEILPEPQQ